MTARFTLEMPEELLARVDEARGDVPRNRWLRRAVEQALGVCGVVSASGRYGELLACALPKDHEDEHAWASLPTFIDGEPQGWIDPIRPGKMLS